MPTIRTALAMLAPVLLAVILGVASARGAVAGDRYALLVGVSAYPELDPSDRLEGPANDVALMRRLLADAGFPTGSVTVLADGVEGADGQPTRRAILGALSGLGGKVGPGDFVVFYFAGHGAQQPSRAVKARAELDGSDEIFLPLDAAPARRGDATLADALDGGGVVNAILDSELGDAITAIRRRGAFVWAIMDSCHSAGAVRALPSSALPARAKQRDRTVPASRLGLANLPATHRSMGASDGGTGGRAGETRLPPAAGQDGALGGPLGGYVGFFAVQSRESTPELVWSWQSESGKVHGLFTATLAEALLSARPRSYRLLAEQVLYRYRAENRFHITPSIEGTLLDSPVFGTDNRPIRPVWPLAFEGSGNARAASLSAGHLHGLGEGALVAILRQPADEQPLGYAEVERADGFRAVLKPVARDRRAAVPWRDVPDDAVARLEDTRSRFELTVARPPTSARTRTEAEKRLFEALSTLARAAAVEGVAVRWVEADQPAKLRLVVQGDRLWLLAPSAALVTSGPRATPSIKGDADVADIRQALVESLRQAAKVVNLAQLAQSFSSTALARSVRVTASVVRDGMARPEPLDPLWPPTLAHGDAVTFDLRNEGDKDVDVTALFIDSGYGVKALFPDAGEDNRLPAKGTLSLPMTVLTRGADGVASTLGPESVVFLMTEAVSKEMRSDFTILEQPSLPRSRAVGDPAGGAASSFDALVLQAAFGGQATRAAGRMPPAANDRAAIRYFGWSTGE